MAAFPTSRTFGVLPNGEAVEAWTLRGLGGLLVEIISYGATITRLLAPDRNGHLADVVLGFNDLDSYLASRAYFGAVVGRVAGRIPGASFILDGETYELARNDPPNHLHGGIEGFDKRIWRASPIENPAGAPTLSMNYSSPDGEEGYPGSTDAIVKYTVTDENVFLVETEAVANRPTPFSLTMHHYFNLGGEGACSITDHELQIYSDEFVLVDDCMTVLGHIGSVKGRSNDFNQLRNLGDAIPFLFQNHGDLYRVRRTGPKGIRSRLAPAARLVHPFSGRILEVSTTEAYVQLYTGAGLDGSLTGKSGTRYSRYAGVCLECEGYPGWANAPSLGDIILRPGHPQRHSTAYAFSAAS